MACKDTSKPQRRRCKDSGAGRSLSFRLPPDKTLLVVVFPSGVKYRS